MAEHKIYTVTDLSRYHSGAMSTAEMHALEKAALSDPFLADALEGYAYTGTAGKDIAELSEQLAGKQKQGKVFFLSPRANNGWLRIAAMLVIFAGAAYMFYLFNKQEPATGLAEHKIKSPAADTTNIIATPAPDSINTTGYATVHDSEKNVVKVKAATGNTVTLQSNAYTQTTMPDGIKTERKSPGRNENFFYYDSVSFNATASAAIPINGTTVFKPADDFVLKGSVTDKTGAPVQGAYVNVNSNIQAVTDRNGKFQVKTPEPAVSASVTSTGFTAKDVALSNIAQNNISLAKESSKKASPVSESGIATKENSNRLRTAVNENGTLSSMSGKMAPIDSVMFNDYADKSFQKIYDSTGKEYEGKVVLSFTVNKKGVPENIKVERSLCRACDEEAVMLLKNGPHWLYVPDKKRQVVVEF